MNASSQSEFSLETSFSMAIHSLKSSVDSESEGDFPDEAFVAAKRDRVNAANRKGVLKGLIIDLSLV